MNYLKFCGQNQFKPIFDTPSINLKGRNFRVMARPNGLKQSRLGTVVGKKKLKLAVRRNWVKRIIRESFQAHCLNFKALDVVVIYTAYKLSNAKEMQVCLQTQWIKLNQF